MTKRISKAQQTEMIDAYLRGASAKESAARVGYSEPTCYAVLRSHGIPVRSLSEATRIHTVDINFFDTIDSEEKAYWLGFITADGSIHSKNHSLAITLQSKDKAHLRKFAASLQSNHPIHAVRQGLRNHSRLVIGSIHLANSLARLGVTPNKVFTVTPCAAVPRDLRRHYWHGVFDGDGSIHNLKRMPWQAPAWGLKLVGNKFMVEGFALFCREFTMSKAQVRPQLRSFHIKYSGVDLIQNIVRTLYEDATVYLDRTKKLANKILLYRR